MPRKRFARRANESADRPLDGLFVDVDHAGPMGGQLVVLEVDVGQDDDDVTDMDEAGGRTVEADLA